MRKAISVLATLAVLGSSMTSFVAPASAQGRHYERERYVSRYCDRNPRDRDCYDFRRNRGHWDDDRYRRWYRSHHHNDDAAAALFGFAAGAILGGALSGAARSSGGGSAHVQWCYDRYRSYRASDNTFQPYDGPRRQCISPYSR